MTRVIRIFLLVVVSTRLCFGQTIPDLIRFPPADSLAHRDFEPIAPYFKDKRVVLAGEASHGGREFFTVKTALFKYLVEKQGFRHFVLEENLSVCEKFNAYIAGEVAADVKTLVKEAYYIWPYHTEEFSNLLVWMRAYNTTKPQAEQIRFWGIDIQFAYGSLKLLEEELYRINNRLKLSIPELPRAEHFLYRAPDSTLAAIESQISRLKKAHPEKGNLARHLEAVRMKNTYSSLQREGMYSTEASSRYRDSCMAVNVVRILNQIGKDDKVMIWGHNAHVAKSFNTALWKAPMGAFLSEMLPDQVYSIGFDYNQGELLLHVPNKGFSPIAVKPRENHDLARLLDKEDYHLLYIPIPSTPHNQSLLSLPVRMRREHVLMKSPYSELYDGLFFINTISATSPLN